MSHTTDGRVVVWVHSPTSGASVLTTEEQVAHAAIALCGGHLAIVRPYGPSHG